MKNLNDHPNFRIAINRLHPVHVQRVRRRALWLYLLALVGVLGWLVFCSRFGVFK